MKPNVVAKIVADTSVIIAVITNETLKQRLVNLTYGADIIAPPSLHWEVGNALSAMFKRKRIDLKQAMRAIKAYDKIPIKFCDIKMNLALKIADELNIYAYDAYFIGCASQFKGTLLSLDKNLLNAAKKYGVKIIEVNA